MADIAAPPAPSPIPAPAPAPSPTPTAPPVPSGGTPAIAPPATPADPPKPQSARAKMHEELAKRAKPANGAVDPNAPKDLSKPPQGQTPEPPPAKPGEKPSAGSPPADGKPGPKESPWKLVDRYKGRVTELETELARYKTSPVPQDDKKSYEDRITKAEARAKELEEHMHYVDYSKTQDFKDKYVQPYEKAWSNAISELKEITFTDAGGAERAITPNDILELVNLPLAKAREIADASFGKFADDVMNHRKEIKKLFDTQQQALEEARKNGGESLKQKQEEAQKQFDALRGTIKKEWEAENSAVLADKTYGQFFSPREGNDDWNTRLQKGFELVDKAFSQNPSDPKFTPEQRQSIIRLHTAVRNRAAAWGALRAENETQKTQIEDLKKELAQYKGSEPGTNGGRINPGNGGAKIMTARERMHEELRRRSKPQ